MSGIGTIRLANLAEIWTTGSAPLPAAANQGALKAQWKRWLDAARAGDDEELAAFAQDAHDDPAANALLAAVFGNSPYLARSLTADLPFARSLVQDGPEAACAAALAAAADTAGLGAESTPDVMKRLRIAKRRAALAIGMADIASLWPLERLTGALSGFAAAALGACCRHLLRGLHDAGELALPEPAAPERGSGLIVLGMGKLGAGELNYSSDIDLILLYDEARTPHTGGDGMQRAFVQLARNLVSLMDERTADGYVFRTDLRLRPDPGSTAPALSVEAAAAYYASVGKTWERAAMIKAHPVAGDVEAGRAFLETLRPFVWRRHLDFAAVQDIQAIKRQINAHRGSARIAVAGHDMKLGRGGIREIEFLAQTQQLVWGGRDADLRDRGTLRTLDGLVAAGHLARKAAVELRAAYEFHRRIEHRLQMTEDQQTHSLPKNDDGLARLAAFLGFESAAAMADAILAQLRTVEGHYAALFEDRPELPGRADLDFTGDGDDPGALAAISALGFAAPERVSAMVRGWRAGAHPAMQDARARDLLVGLAPAILETFAASPDPEAALSRFDGFLARLPHGVQLFSLFAARPELFRLVAEIMASAPRLAQRLGDHPALLDSVLSRDFADLELPDDLGLDDELADTARRGLVRLFYAREFGIEEMQAELASLADGARDVQDFLDAARRWANDRSFQIGVHMLRGFLTPVEAARPLSDIADACLRALLPAIADDLAAAHGRPPGGRAALAALGELGGRETTPGAALDLTLIYDCDPGAGESDGASPLTPEAWYAELFRRLVDAVSAQTGEGRLYEVRVPPGPDDDGEPAARSLAAFAAQAEAAEGWGPALRDLARARVVYAESDPGAESDLGERIEAIRQAALSRPRARAALAGEIVAMREDLQDAAATDDPWSVERMPGGLLDAELIARFVQLAGGGRTDGAPVRDPVAVFEAARERGRMDADAADELIEAVTLWRNMRGVLRLTVEGTPTGEDATPALKAVMGRSCGALVFESFDETVRDVAARAAAHFDSLVGKEARGTPR